MKKRGYAEKQSKKKRLASILVSAVFFVVGVVMLLYPAIADYVNTHRNREIIETYQRLTEEAEGVDFDAMMQSARDYNERLFRRAPYMGALTEEAKQDYESQLDLLGTGFIGYIEIRKINVYLPIFHGTSNDVLQSAIGHVEGSSFPIDGESVHAVVSGHSGLPSARLFTDVDQLVVGDTFIIHVLNKNFVYQVDEISKVLPDDLKDLHIDEGRELCTVMTCTPYSVNTHRLVVTGHRIEVPEGETPDGEPALDEPAGPPAWDAGQLTVPLTIIAAVIFISAAAEAVFSIKRRGKRIK